MGIADNMLAGANFIDSLQRGKILDAQARVAPQMAQNGLAASNLQTQYMPSNLDVANQMAKAKLAYQLIANQYAPMTAQANNAYKMAMGRYMGGPNMSMKYMTPLGKSYVEPGIVNQNLQNQGMQVLPGGMAASGVPAMQQQLNNPPPSAGLSAPMMQPPAPPSSQDPNGLTVDPQQMQAAYAAMRQKQTSDVATRNKAKFAVNIQKTFDEIDPSVITPYAGVQGAAQLKMDQANALIGKTSPQYQKYNNFVKVQVPIMADQIRQFYGTSIQPEMYRSLQQLTNPVTWNSNPQLAMSQFIALKELLGKEMATYQDNLNAPVPATPMSTNKANSGAVNMPSFNSKQEFQKWYAGLPPAMQVAVKQQMGDK
jgi:hypothetical protein